MEEWAWPIVSNWSQYKLKQGSYPDENRGGREQNVGEYFHLLEGEGKTVSERH